MRKGYSRWITFSCKDLALLQDVGSWKNPSLNDFWVVLERSELTGSWQMLPQFSRRARRRSPEITGLSVPGKVMEKLFCSHWKTPERQNGHWSQPVELYEKVLFIKSHFLLWQGNPFSKSGEASWGNPLGFQ